MKKLIKSLVPNDVMPFAQKAYWKVFAHSAKSQRHAPSSALRCMVSYNRFGGYCVPESSRHRPAARKILSHDVYEPGTIEFMVSHCANGDVVHAGTYFGDFLPALSKGIAPGSKVWAFEPNPENYRCARITLEINDIQNIVLTHAGLGAKQDYLHIKTADENGCSLGGASRIIAQEPDGAAAAESVRIVTIDDTVRHDRDISIIQLDVEGYEKEVLAGGLKTIQRCRPTLILEVLPNSTLLGSNWFAENILSLGYRKLADIHGNSVFSSAGGTA
jgi:FkbM family methyltransferase